jgi:hypothetical protein
MTTTDPWAEFAVDRDCECGWEDVIDRRCELHGHLLDKEADNAQLDQCPVDP